MENMNKGIKTRFSFIFFIIKYLPDCFAQNKIKYGKNCFENRSSMTDVVGKSFMKLQSPCIH
jgi:hypothetical protein